MKPPMRYLLGSALKGGNIGTLIGWHSGEYLGDSIYPSSYDSEREEAI